MRVEATKYPWAEELEKTVVQSLTTSFGLDFLLFKDKVGGEVDTIHNVRNGIWGTKKEQRRYSERGGYNSDDYHKHDNYKEAGKKDKLLQQEGQLNDAYRNSNMRVDEKKMRDLDHVISAKEVHDDPGRILADLNGVELANQDSNLQSTHRSINRSKQAKSIDKFLDDLPGTIATHENTLFRQKERLAAMPRDTPEQQHNARELEKKINNSEVKIKALKSVNPDKMRERDKEAREPYNQQIAQKYYTSSKFWQQTASASAMAGVRMGTRQMLGLVLAEIWFELREQMPKIFEKLKHSFDLERFLDSIRTTLQGIWRRVQRRFLDFLVAFKDGVFAGVMASATTTLFNIFATTQKMAIKIIRELWGHSVKAIKLMIFNPEKLSFVDLCKAVVAILSVGVATVVGTIVYAELLPLCSFPFGSELVAFASALVTGIITLGLNYFLLYSGVAQKLWEFVDSIMPYATDVRKFQAVNEELDRYLMELGRLEFNLDVDELEEFSQQLIICNNEIRRGLLLQQEVAKREIALPYEMGNSASTRKWLSSLGK